MVQPGKKQISLGGKVSSPEGERHRRRRSAHPSQEGKRPRHPRDHPKGHAKGAAVKRRSQWKVMATITAVCLAAALAFQAFTRADFQSVASFFLFGSTDPYMSPKREREMNREFTDMIKREFGPK